MSKAKNKKDTKLTRAYFQESLEGYAETLRNSQTRKVLIEKTFTLSISNINPAIRFYDPDTYLFTLPYSDYKEWKKDSRHINSKLGR